jgi:hypothetical protein
VKKIHSIISKLITFVKRKLHVSTSTPVVTSSSSSSTRSSSKSQIVSSSSSSSTSGFKSQGTATSTTSLPPQYLAPKTLLQSFFDDAISMYVLPDVERLTNEIRPDDRGLKKGLRGCTIPLAMMLFAVIDLFGFLMREDKKTDTKGNFEYLLSKSGYFPPIYKSNCERILKLYRHGVMHQIFPKASAITKAGPNRALMDTENGTLVLNVDRLSRDVVKAINQVEESVKQKRDNQLITRMSERLEKLAKEDYQTMANL